HILADAVAIVGTIVCTLCLHSSCRLSLFSRILFGCVADISFHTSFRSTLRHINLVRSTVDKTLMYLYRGSANTSVFDPRF
ncbi:uncharacterized protein EDB91DRAFT_1115177, partial [Suillus paluster]|uniref:uncharacterized protein n=1 Tax=Suillus paluster TaxID=48578 RepID=UPI001B8813BC